MISNPNVKINLGLNVLRKREDGFHDLETLFIPYPGISDCLEIITGEDWSRTLAGLKEKYGKLTQAVSPGGKLLITIARAEGVDWDPLKDLTAKAYFMLAAQYQLPPMKIYLEKRSPVGAGLGGGSSDAAFALRMMATLAGLNLTDEQLAGYAAQLGSDCAFFIGVWNEGKKDGKLVQYEVDVNYGIPNSMWGPMFGAPDNPVVTTGWGKIVDMTCLDAE